MLRLTSLMQIVVLFDKMHLKPFRGQFAAGKLDGTLRKASMGI